MQLQIKIISKILAIALLYSVLRYNIFSNVPWQDLPLFVFNKAISLSIVLLLFYNQLSIMRRKHVIDVGIGITLLVISHVILSVILQSPEYYGKFYIGQKLNLIGSSSLLFGLFAFLGFSLTVFIRFAKNNETIYQSKISIEKIKISSLIFISIHLFVMGINGWLTPTNWPGYMPPISLISFVIISLALLMNIQENRNK